MAVKAIKSRGELALLVLILVGLADSVYLTIVELGGAPLYCAHTGIINCQAVIFSRYGNILGLPLAYYVLAWFIISLILFFVAKKIRNYWYVLGVFGVLYSVAAMYALGEICEYCSLLDVCLLGIAIFAAYNLK